MSGISACALGNGHIYINLEDLNSTWGLVHQESVLARRTHGKERESASTLLGHAQCVIVRRGHICSCHSDCHSALSSLTWGYCRSKSPERWLSQWGAYHTSTRAWVWLPEPTWRHWLCVFCKLWAREVETGGCTLASSPHLTSELQVQRKPVLKIKTQPQTNKQK